MEPCELALSVSRTLWLSCRKSHAGRPLSPQRWTFFKLILVCLHLDMDKFRDCAIEGEHHDRDSEDAIQDNTTTVCTFLIKVKTLEPKAHHAENQNCGYNLQIVEVPEGAEGPDMVAFMERLLCTLLQQLLFSTSFVVAHRMPMHPTMHLHFLPPQFL